MPTRNEQKRSNLTKKIASIEARMQPIQRLKAYYEGELELLDQYEADENQLKLALPDKGEV
jgi:hypothetical protein